MLKRVSDSSVALPQQAEAFALSPSLCQHWGENSTESGTWLPIVCWTEPPLSWQFVWFLRWETVFQPESFKQASFEQDTSLRNHGKRAHHHMLTNHIFVPVDRCCCHHCCSCCCCWLKCSLQCCLRYIWFSAWEERTFCFAIKHFREKF